MPTFPIQGLCLLRASTGCCLLRLEDVCIKHLEHQVTVKIQLPEKWLITTVKERNGQVVGSVQSNQCWSTVVVMFPLLTQLSLPLPRSLNMLVAKTIGTRIGAIK
ncbi:uncharacterized protein LOC111241361 [Vigna radiata var. radiata]|uniref:Uncharacterized protein LOC111241361 n=1 Tax=Vigna radiata var. radiata TaxID=3916 RepID=A0A3Q0EWZ8_VIGRR|nr:uncharacterized protein LOC111241361 [Vigna radiata var. radiata]XP_022634672.1 uncharacterized protein LOC111241361 [Vigna radiata var. radiata]